MNEGENSGMPNGPIFSSPNIAGSQPQPQQAPVPMPEQPVDVTKTDNPTLTTTIAAMPEQDGPLKPTVTSGGDAVDKKKPRFGLGTRRFKEKTQTPAAPIMQAAQPTAFANAPEFFNDAVGDIVLADAAEAEKKGKIKKFAIIGGIAVAAVAVVAIIISVLSSINSGSPQKKLASLQELTGEYEDSIRFHEDRIKYAETNRYSLAFPFSSEKAYRDFEKKQNDDIANIKAYRKSLDSYSSYSIKDKYNSKDIKEYVNGLKSVLDNRIGVYEKINKVMLAVAKVGISNGDSNVLKELEASTDVEGIKTVVSKYEAYYKKRAAYLKQKKTCSGKECDNIAMQLSNLNVSLRKEKSLNAVVKAIASEINPKEDDPMELIKNIKNAYVKEEIK